MIRPEQYAGLVIPPNAIRGATASRDAAGAWKLRFDLDVAFPLPDGRVVKFDKAVSVKGHQRGRKPVAEPPRAKAGRKRTKTA